MPKNAILAQHRLSFVYSFWRLVMTSAMPPAKNLQAQHTYWERIETLERHLRSARLQQLWVECGTLKSIQSRRQDLTPTHIENISDWILLNTWKQEVLIQTDTFIRGETKNVEEDQREACDWKKVSQSEDTERVNVCMRPERPAATGRTENESGQLVATVDDVPNNVIDGVGQPGDAPLRPSGVWRPRRIKNQRYVSVAIVTPTPMLASLHTDASFNLPSINGGKRDQLSAGGRS